MPDCILTDLEALRESFTKEARIYTKQGAVPDGARPHECTAWQLACGYMAGSYRVAAHEVGKVIKKHRPMSEKDPAFSDKQPLPTHHARH